MGSGEGVFKRARLMRGRVSDEGETLMEFMAAKEVA